MENKLVLDCIKQSLMRLSQSEIISADVIEWASPVLCFGNLNTARIATLGLNPSNKEFVDNNGIELIGSERRFHTLRSLGLTYWSEISDLQLQMILDSYFDYFYGNPYDAWFKKIDYVLADTGLSYYFPSSGACHLDLIPFATFTKWTELSPFQRKNLLIHSIDILGILLEVSSIKVLVLNGQTVVNNLESIGNFTLNKKLMLDWTLPRLSGNGIAGYSYQGIIKNIGGITLSKEIVVLGYNHNIQSSYGVTKQVQDKIKNWIFESSKHIL